MHQKLNSVLRVAGAIVSIALAAQITFDIGEIPITGQTLAILTWAFFLKEKEAVLALCIYLIAGFCGVPIFADGAHGLEKLFGGSGGYLVGFLVAAFSVSYLQNRYKFTSLLSFIGITLMGTTIILLFGIARLMIIYGLEKGLDYGLIPFWKGAIIKILIGSFLVWAIKISTNRQAPTQ
jgi:biotin transport system substrate-specific component